MARRTVQTIIEHLAEESTGVFACAFQDEDGQAITPKSATWTLTDTSGNVINSREAVAISPVAATVNVVLSGDDLSISDGFEGTAEERVLTVAWLYDSDLGTDLPGKGECRFYIDNLVAL
jgi:hypothetical protein